MKDSSRSDPRAVVVLGLLFSVSPLPPQATRTPTSRLAFFFFLLSAGLSAIRRFLRFSFFEIACVSLSDCFAFQRRSPVQAPLFPRTASLDGRCCPPPPSLRSFLRYRSREPRRSGHLSVTGPNYRGLKEISSPVRKPFSPPYPFFFPFSSRF